PTDQGRRRSRRSLWSFTQDLRGCPCPRVAARATPSIERTSPFLRRRANLAVVLGSPRIPGRPYKRDPVDVRGVRRDGDTGSGARRWGFVRGDRHRATAAAAVERAAQYPPFCADP